MDWLVFCLIIKWATEMMVIIGYRGWLKRAILIRHYHCYWCLFLNQVYIPLGLVHIVCSKLVKIVLLLSLIVLKNIELRQESCYHFQSVFWSVETMLFRVKHLLPLFKLWLYLLNFLCNSLSTFPFLLWDGRVYSE